MMKSKFLLVATAVLLVGNAFAMKVYTDHDSTFDFSQAKTVIWVPGTPASDELMQRRIVAAVEEQLKAKGLTVVESGKADLQVATHATTTSQKKQSGGNVSVGVSKRTSWGSIGVGGRGNKRVHEITTGTLVIDITDPVSGHLVWSAKASDTVDGDPDKVEQKIYKATEKAFKDFPPKGE